MALPDGVPERLPVTCNGRSAVFLLRSQRVVFQDHDMAPSRFEQLSGKGDAKKWKCSIFTEDADGEPVRSCTIATCDENVSALLHAHVLLGSYSDA